MKKKLTAEYEAALNRGLTKLSLEAQVIGQTKRLKRTNKKKAHI